MKPKIISFANHKGGVGKTTSALNVGAALAERGFNVLMVDTDAQANLTASLLAAPPEGRTIYHALRERRELPIVELFPKLSLVPSSLDLAGIELELAGATGRESILKKLLGEASQGFDFVLIDCAPALSLIAVNCFVASSIVLVPLTAETLPINGLTMIEEVLERVRESLNEEVSIRGIFFTRWQGVKLNKMAEELLRETYGKTLMETKIRTCITIAEAPLTKSNIFTYAPKSNGAKDYNSLTEELLCKVLG